MLMMSEPHSTLYYSQVWRELHEEIDGGKSMLFTHEDEHGKVVYPLVCRPVHVAVNHERYFDIATPKGYSGPTILSCAEGKEKELLRTYKERFELFCERNNIVCEFVRFNPWLKNHEHFRDEYDVVRSGRVYGIDLTVGDVFTDEITSKTRNCIRKARKLGVEVHYDYEGESLPEFLRLYQWTVTKNNISQYYQFSKERLERYFNALKGKIFILNAYFEGQVVSSCMFILEGAFIHYNYSATNPEFYHSNANSLLLYEACEKGKRDGKQLMDLGGANNDALVTFKQGFSRKGTAFDCYVGKRVRNQQVYSQLVDMCGRNTKYFPEYRNVG